MANIIRAKIDLTKIDKSLIFEGKKGKYIDIAIVENRDGEDRYGNTHFISQDIPKERRESGEKSPILGNGKFTGDGQRQKPYASNHGGDDLDGVPF
jgi:hypothetical protein